MGRPLTGLGQDTFDFRSLVQGNSWWVRVSLSVLFGNCDILTKQLRASSKPRMASFPRMSEVQGQRKAAGGVRVSGQVTEVSQILGLYFPLGPGI